MQEQLPALPPELLERVARLALEAAGGDVREWARLSLVSAAFRAAIRGGQPGPVGAVFGARLTRRVWRPMRGIYNTRRALSQSTHGSPFMLRSWTVWRRTLESLRRPAEAAQQAALPSGTASER